MGQFNFGDFAHFYIGGNSWAGCVPCGPFGCAGSFGVLLSLLHSDVERFATELGQEAVSVVA